MKRIVVLMIIGILIPPIFYFPGEIVLAAPSNVYYVANDGDDGNSGTSQGSPWRTIGKVNSEFGNAISAGDDIYFKRGDTFTDTYLNVQISGVSQSNPTIFGAYGTGELPRISGNVNGIYIYNGREYITIQNLWIENIGTRGIYALENIKHLIIENCEIHNTSSTAGIYIRDTCEYIFIRNNTLSNNNGDSIIMRDTTYGLIENNTIEGGTMNTHSTLVVRTGASYIIIRNNTIFDPNPTQWGGHTGDAAQFLYATDHCVFENNIIYDTDGVGFKIQGGYAHIIRNNQIRDCLIAGTGAYAQSGTPGDVHDNIWYHNTIYNSGTGGYMHASFRFFVYSSSDGDHIRNNIVKNNILFKCDLNTRVVYLDGDTGYEYLVHDNIFDNNIIYDTSAGQDVLFIGGSTTYSVSEVESAFPSDFMNNIQSDPELTDAGNGDFTLNSVSPAIDAAAWLTLCNGGGTGTAITVDNAGYFCDGFGMIDGDKITVGTDDVTITDVNYGTNVITVTPSITWSDNDPVSLRYSGSAPDIGAKESAASGWSNSAPTLSNEGPEDTSTGISRYPQLNITVTDADGNNSEVYWYTNASGSWYLMQTNSSVLNATVRLMNFTNASSYSTTYYWRVSANDTHDNTTETYHFTTESITEDELTSPANLVASNPTTSSISLEWNKGYMGGTLVHDILYVDNFTKYAGNPIFDKSDTGSWADYGIRENALLTNSTGHIVKVDGKYVIYFNGRTYTPSKITRIGRATSTDGENWDVANDYVFSDTTANYYTFVGSVIQRGENDYIMYYGALNESSEGIIKYATSSDSITWTAQNEILNENEFTNATTLNIPYVIYFDNEWHMVMEGDVSPSQGFKIFYANSSDGENWTATADAIYSGSSGEWDSEDAANPSLYKLDTGKYVIFYNGNSQESGYIFDLGVLYSTSVTSGWTSWKNNPILEHGADTEWDDTRLEGPRLYMDDMGNATLRMWYFGLPTAGSFANGAIGYAICNETITNTMVRYSTSDNLSTYTDGSLGYNGTDSYTTITGLNPDTKYYFRAWSWNETEGWNTTGSNTVNENTLNPPTADYIWSDADGAGSGTMINFDASSSTDDNGITLYEWDWNDDGTYDFSSASPTASHDYGDINLHDCTLRVTDTYSQTDTFTDTVQANVDNPPEITNINLIESDPLDTNPSFGWINITCDVTDNIAVDEVSLSITNPDGSYNNVSMNAGAGDSYYYNSSTAFSTYGNYSYLIWANDTNGNPSTSTVYDFSMPPNWDINKDGQCTILDLTLISSHYGETGQNGWIREDVDNNGIVQVLDFIMVTEHYGESWWT